MVLAQVDPREVLLLCGHSDEHRDFAEICEAEALVNGVTFFRRLQHADAVAQLRGDSQRLFGRVSAQALRPLLGERRNTVDAGYAVQEVDHRVADRRTFLQNPEVLHSRGGGHIDTDLASERLNRNCRALLNAVLQLAL